MSVFNKLNPSGVLSAAGSLASRMNVFRSAQTLPYAIHELGLVVQDLVQAFEHEGFSFKCNELQPGIWEIDFIKGGAIKVAMGMRPSLKVSLQAVPDGIRVEAGVGILKGSSQILSLPTQQGLDNFALEIVTASLKARGTMQASTNLVSSVDLTDESAQ